MFLVYLNFHHTWRITISGELQNGNSHHHDRDVTNIAEIRGGLGIIDVMRRIGYAEFQYWIFGMSGWPSCYSPSCAIRKIMLVPSSTKYLAGQREIYRWVQAVINGGFVMDEYSFIGIIELSIPLIFIEAMERQPINCSQANFCGS